MRKKIIKNFTINTDNIKSDGEDRRFIVSGTSGAVFSMQIVNNHNHYYNFSSRTFSAARSALDNVEITSGSYSGSINFPALTDTNTDYYDIYIFASARYNTEHAKYKEVRFDDDSIDINSSRGSNSLLLTKKIYQRASLDLSIVSYSIAGGAFGSMTAPAQDIIVDRGKSGGKIPFKITATAAATRNFVIDRQPVSSDIAVSVNRVIGAAAIPIKGEDISSTTYYKWPINNISGLKPGMAVTGGSIVSNTNLKDYSSSLITDTKEVPVKSKEIFVKDKSGVLKPSPAKLSKELFKPKPVADITMPPLLTTTKFSEVFERSIQPIGKVTLTDEVRSQAGNVVFNLQQPDALKDDTVTFWGYGTSNISSLTGYELEFSDLKVELTPFTTTVDGAVSNHTNVTVDERTGIRSGVSTVKGIGIDDSTAVPTVASGADAVSGSGVIVLSAAQTLEDNTVLTFGVAGRIITITGNIEIKKAGLANLTLRVILDNFITAT